MQHLEKKKKKLLKRLRNIKGFLYIGVKGCGEDLLKKSQKFSDVIQIKEEPIRISSSLT